MGQFPEHPSSSSSQGSSRASNWTSLGTEILDFHWESMAVRVLFSLLCSQTRRRFLVVWWRSPVPYWLSSALPCASQRKGYTSTIWGWLIPEGMHWPCPPTEQLCPHTTGQSHVGLHHQQDSQYSHHQHWGVGFSSLQGWTRATHISHSTKRILHWNTKESRSLGLGFFTRWNSCLRLFCIQILPGILEPLRRARCFIKWKIP